MTTGEGGGDLLSIAAILSDFDTSDDELADTE